jgi:hypothetical protein
MKYLPPGTYPGVVCRGCGSVGELLVFASGERGVERLAHAPGCEFGREQPEHFKRRKAAIRRQEKSAAKILGTKMTAASGALGGDNDSRRSGWFRGENKSTETGRYVVTPAWWKGFYERAIAQDEEPLLQVDFVSTGRTVRLAMMRWDSWFSETGVGATSIEPKGKKNLHLRPSDSQVRRIPWLEPEAVVVSLEFWSHKYPERR